MFKSSEILGINARNLLYLSKYNSKANKRFADDKIFTKRFLESRQIGVAKLYHVINNHQQLTNKFFESLPNSFVVKPNHGFAGAGIIVIKNKKEKYWLTISNKKVSQDELFLQCISILEGKYSISGLGDQIIFEEVLEMHSDFRSLTQVGLPDIRVIVFNLVPTIAMLRVPTPESDGKANMELGAIALGIDMGTGKTTGAALYSKYITQLPNGESARNFQIPFWDDILKTSSEIQQYTKIGFLGVDLVITKTGIKILEVNARSGLKIQIANKVALQARLKKIIDLKVLTPANGVKIAKTLFSTKEYKKDVLDKPIIGIKELVILNGEKPRKCIAQINLQQNKNYISAEYYDGPKLDIIISGKRIKFPVEKADTGEFDIILAGKHLYDFYIDPTKEYHPDSSCYKTSNIINNKILQSIDTKIYLIDTQIKLLKYINPQNLEEQRILFLENPTFSPQFIYRPCNLDFVQMRNDLKRIPEIDHILSPLYKEKITELLWKISLLESLDSENFSECSKQVFGSINKSIYQHALRFIKKNSDIIDDTSPILDTKKSIEVLNNFLKKYHLGHWKIKIIEDSVSDIQVTKLDTILLKKNASFSKNRLEALLVHEIGTHVFRFENGKLQPLKILERGTANYLKTEEGLAIWNQNQLGLNFGMKNLTAALHIITIYMAEKLSFVDLFHFLKNTHNLNNEVAWKHCIKTKRGLKNTEQKSVFTKDSIYFIGNREIEKFVSRGGNVHDLYVGKISVTDLPLVQKIPNLRSGKFLLN